jgi:succinyl-CoA synthetase beta subunit
MNIHEYQAKKILQKYGIPTPPFYVVSNIKELISTIERHHLQKAVLKVQVHAGGRGKSGGVKIAKNPEEILRYGEELLGKKIVNNQTGKEGLISHQILVSELVDIDQEYYVGAIIDRNRAEATFILSPEGGMDIEEIGKHSPDRILKIPIALSGKMHSYQLWRIAKFMGWSGNIAQEGMKIISALAKAFVETDAALLEINPLVKTKGGALTAVDAKWVIDDNALWRQPEMKSYYDPTQLPVNEAKANEYNLSYISLHGDIGCMVNGAGLAMATMDIIHYYGGHPANFLDVGGGASQERIAEGFRIILLDPKVKAIFVNIFGGIMNCEILAMGLIDAAKNLKIEVPIVVRMEGTNVEQGKKKLKDSGLNLIVSENFSEAAKKVVEASHGHSS